MVAVPFSHAQRPRRPQMLEMALRHAPVLPPLAPSPTLVYPLARLPSPTLVQLLPPPLSSCCRAPTRPRSSLALTRPGTRPDSSS